MQVSNILAKYPHWDRPPRRLKLPALTRDSTELPDTTDHIKPSSWRGDVRVSSVTLQTCWRRGRHLVETECPFTVEILRDLEKQPAVNILSPQGKLLVKLPAEADESAECIPFNFQTGAPDPRSPELPCTPNENSVEIENAILEEDTGLSSDTGHDADDMSPSANDVTHPPKVNHWIMYNGKKMLKSRAVSLCS